jgi:anaerobic selenocysteine-containing dehydrogenase
MSSKISAGSGAQTPDDSSQVTVGDRAEEAGGSAAILSTLHELRRNDTGLLRGMRTLLQVNQPEGVDCPGCAWPESAGERSEIEFCENGAKAVSWETTRRRIDADFFARHSVAELAAGSDYQLGQLGRLTEPLYLPPGGTHYQPIAWDAAYRLIADELGSLSSPHEAAFYTSGRTSNEAAFLFQLLVRQLGTNNLPDCANLCHESSGVALKETVGVGKGTVQLDDFEQADAIFILGQNPGTNHPRMMSVLQKAAQRGCQIVAVNPLPEAALLRFAHPQSPLELLGGGTAITSLFLPVRIDGDAALLKGIMKELLDEERKRPGQVFDWEFIREHTVRHRRAAPRPRRGDLGRGGHRLGPHPGPGSCRRCGVAAQSSHHCLLGDGADAAQGGGGDDSASGQPAAPRWAHRATGGGAVSGARALECAGRPYDGHHPQDRRRLSAATVAALRLCRTVAAGP